MKSLMILAKPYPSDARVYPEAQSLIKEGHEITLLSWDKNANNPKKETLDGINVIRSPNSKVMDLLPYDIFRLHWWWNKGYKDAIKLFEKKTFDVVHCHDLNSLPIGVKLKKKFDIPLIYDAHEIWGYMVSRDLPKIWADYYLWKEKRLVKYVDHLITVNQPLKEFFEKIFDKQITVVMNAKPLQSKKYEPSNNKQFTICYIGVIGKPRFLLELVEVVKKIKDVTCFIAGSGSKKTYVNELKEKCSKVDNVDYIGRIPMDEVIPMTKKSNVVVCMFDPNDKNSKVGLPNKVFESMVAGRPIIASKEVYLGKFVEEENIGLSIPFDKNSLRKAIISLRDNPHLCDKLGRNALNAAIDQYNWDVQEQKLLQLHERLEN